MGENGNGSVGNGNGFLNINWRGLESLGRVIDHLADDSSVVEGSVSVDENNPFLASEDSVQVSDSSSLFSSFNIQDRLYGNGQKLTFLAIVDDYIKTRTQAGYADWKRARREVGLFVDKQLGLFDAHKVLLEAKSQLKAFELEMSEYTVSTVYGCHGSSAPKFENIDFDHITFKLDGEAPFGVVSSATTDELLFVPTEPLRDRAYFLAQIAAAEEVVKSLEGRRDEILAFVEREAVRRKWGASPLSILIDSLDNKSLLSGNMWVQLDRVSAALDYYKEAFKGGNEAEIGSAKKSYTEEVYKLAGVEGLLEEKQAIQDEYGWLVHASPKKDRYIELVAKIAEVDQLIADDLSAIRVNEGLLLCQELEGGIGNEQKSLLIDNALSVSQSFPDEYPSMILDFATCVSVAKSDEALMEEIYNFTDCTDEIDVGTLSRALRDYRELIINGDFEGASEARQVASKYLDLYFSLTEGNMSSIQSHIKRAMDNSDSWTDKEVQWNIASNVAESVFFENSSLASARMQLLDKIELDALHDAEVVNAAGHDDLLTGISVLKKRYQFITGHIFRLQSSGTPLSFTDRQMLEKLEALRDDVQGKIIGAVFEHSNFNFYSSQLAGLIDESRIIKARLSGPIGHSWMSASDNWRREDCEREIENIVTHAAYPEFVLRQELKHAERKIERVQTQRDEAFAVALRMLSDIPTFFNVDKIDDPLVAGHNIGLEAIDASGNPVLLADVGSNPLGVATKTSLETPEAQEFVGNLAYEMYLNAGNMLTGDHERIQARECYTNAIQFASSKKQKIALKLKILGTYPARFLYENKLTALESLRAEMISLVDSRDSIPELFEDVDVNIFGWLGDVFSDKKEDLSESNDTRVLSPSERREYAGLVTKSWKLLFSVASSGEDTRIIERLEKERTAWLKHRSSIGMTPEELTEHQFNFGENVSYRLASLSQLRVGEDGFQLAKDAHDRLKAEFDLMVGARRKILPDQYAYSGDSVFENEASFALSVFFDAYTYRWLPLTGFKEYNKNVWSVYNSTYSVQSFVERIGARYLEPNSSGRLNEEINVGDTQAREDLKEVVVGQDRGFIHRWLPEMSAAGTGGTIALVAGTGPKGWAAFGIGAVVSCGVDKVQDYLAVLESKREIYEIGRVGRFFLPINPQYIDAVRRNNLIEDFITPISGGLMFPAGKVVGTGARLLVTTEGRRHIIQRTLLQLGRTVKVASMFGRGAWGVVRQGADDVARLFGYSGRTIVQGADDVARIASKSPLTQMTPYEIASEQGLLREFETSISHLSKAEQTKLRAEMARHLANDRGIMGAQRTLNRALINGADEAGFSEAMSAARARMRPWDRFSFKRPGSMELAETRSAHTRQLVDAWMAENDAVMMGVAEKGLLSQVSKAVPRFMSRRGLVEGQRWGALSRLQQPWDRFWQMVNAPADVFLSSIGRGLKHYWGAARASADKWTVFDSWVDDIFFSNRYFTGSAPRISNINFLNWHSDVDILAKHIARNEYVFNRGALESFRNGGLLRSSQANWAYAGDISEALGVRNIGWRTWRRSPFADVLINDMAGAGALDYSGIRSLTAVTGARGAPAMYDIAGIGALDITAGAGNRGLLTRGIAELGTNIDKFSAKWIYPVFSPELFTATRYGALLWAGDQFGLDGEEGMQTLTGYTGELLALNYGSWYLGLNSATWGGLIALGIKTLTMATWLEHGGAEDMTDLDRWQAAALEVYVVGGLNASVSHGMDFFRKSPFLDTIGNLPRQLIAAGVFLNSDEIFGESGDLTKWFIAGWGALPGSLNSWPSSYRLASTFTKPNYYTFLGLAMSVPYIMGGVGFGSAAFFKADSLIGASDEYMKLRFAKYLGSALVFDQLGNIFGLLSGLGQVMSRLVGLFYDTGNFFGLGELFPDLWPGLSRVFPLFDKKQLWNEPLTKIADGFDGMSPSERDEALEWAVEIFLEQSRSFGITGDTDHPIDSVTNAVSGNFGWKQSLTGYTAFRGWVEKIEDKKKAAALLKAMLDYRIVENGWRESDAVTINAYAMAMLIDEFSAKAEIDRSLGEDSPYEPFIDIRNNPAYTDIYRVFTPPSSWSEKLDALGTIDHALADDPEMACESLGLPVCAGSTLKDYVGDLKDSLGKARQILRD